MNHETTDSYCEVIVITVEGTGFGANTWLAHAYNTWLAVENKIGLLAYSQLMLACGQYERTQDGPNNFSLM